MTQSIVSWRVGILLLLSLSGIESRAADVLVAVSSNFAGTLSRLAPGFEKSSGHRVVMTAGASGKLQAQIANGAPFEVLLSADREQPKRLADQALADPASRFVYAKGRLVLYSAAKAKVEASSLRAKGLKHVAIANPSLAPYGRAAQEYLKSEGLWTALEPRLVMGENIAQTLSFVQFGDAELGFVALSQVLELQEKGGNYWAIPAKSYAPLEQEAVLLKPGFGKDSARAFLDFLKSESARKVIRESGYDVP